MKTETRLARILNDLAYSEKKIESTASELLAVIKTEGIKTAKRWDELVRAAYAANGWHPRPGRPSVQERAKGKVMQRVPSTVRTYVSAVRRALRSDLPVSKYRTFTALRADLAKLGDESRPGAIPRAVRQSFLGVNVQAPREPNGALFHDLSAVYITLPPEHRDVLGRQLSLLLHKYLPLANIAPAAQLQAPQAVEPDLGKRIRKAA